MTNPIAALKLGGKAAVLATLMATASFAQTAAPADGITTMEEVQFPTLDGYATDQEVIDSLSAQGYENVAVVRGDDTLVVSGERGGLPTELIFSATDGTLVLADGIEPVTDDTTAAPADAPVATDASPSTDGGEPASETPAASNFSGQDQMPLDTPTASIEGDETDPVAETIPADAAAPTPEDGDAGQAADGGAETDDNDS